MTTTINTTLEWHYSKKAIIAGAAAWHRSTYGVDLATSHDIAAIFYEHYRNTPPKNWVDPFVRAIDNRHKYLLR